MIFRTTAQDVLDLFNVTSQTHAVLQEWRSDPSKMHHVVPFVERHQTSFLYQLDPDEVERVCQATEHALGKVKRSTAESVEKVVDWNPAFAFTHVLHYAMETMRELPTWQRFREFVGSDDLGRSMLWLPAQERIAQLSADSHGPSRSAIKESMRWRVGNAYYSFLREIYVVAHLRAAGLDVRMHPLADALFRVDFWCGRTVCGLLVKNAKFHKNGQGRKRPVDEILADATPPFQFHKIQLGRASAFGVVHLPSPEHIRLAAKKLHAALQTSRAS